MQWLTPSVNSTTLTLTFDELEGRRNDFDIHGLIPTLGGFDSFPDPTFYRTPE